MEKDQELLLLLQVSRGRKLVPARPGYNSLTRELEMQRCQGTPGISLGLWLSC